MLHALFIVYAVASSALLDDATAADADARAEHIVQLCAEHHRDAVGAAYPRSASSASGRVAMLTSIRWWSRHRGLRSA